MNNNKNFYKKTFLISISANAPPSINRKPATVPTMPIAKHTSLKNQPIFINLAIESLLKNTCQNPISKDVVPHKMSIIKLSLVWSLNQIASIAPK
jgi:hypothetical protein